jgi:hypothetical protein
MKRIVTYTFMLLVLLISSTHKLAAQFGTNTSLEQIDSMLSTMSDEQKMFMIKMAIQNLDDEKKQQVEEALNYITKKEVETFQYNIKNKDIVFIPIAHISQKEFYEDLKNKVAKYKKEGYVVYYEQIIKDTTLTVAQQKIQEIKLKKAMGGILPSRNTYGIVSKLFKNSIPQPQYNELGITSTDINADIKLDDLLNAIEKDNGEITVFECDYDEIPSPNCPKYDLEDKFKYILDFRNEHVVKTIKNSKDKKIVIIYGAKHKDGIINLLNS